MDGTQKSARLVNPTLVKYNKEMFIGGIISLNFLKLSIDPWHFIFYGVEKLIFHTYSVFTLKSHLYIIYSSQETLAELSTIKKKACDGT